MTDSELRSEIDAMLGRVFEAAFGGAAGLRERVSEAAFKALKVAMEESALAERARIVAALRKWADSMHVAPWDDGWTECIKAARTFANQIESGSL